MGERQTSSIIEMISGAAASIIKGRKLVFLIFKACALTGFLMLSEINFSKIIDISDM